MTWEFESPPLHYSNRTKKTLERVSNKIDILKIPAEIAQLVEHWLPKPRVAGSSPVYRSGHVDTLTG